MNDKMKMKIKVRQCSRREVVRSGEEMYTAILVWLPVMYGPMTAIKAAVLFGS